MGLSGAEPLQYCRHFRQYCERSAEDSPTPSPQPIDSQPNGRRQHEAAEGQDQLVLPLGHPSLTDVSAGQRVGGFAGLESMGGRNAGVTRPMQDVGGSERGSRRKESMISAAHAIASGRANATCPALAK